MQQIQQPTREQVRRYSRHARRDCIGLQLGLGLFGGGPAAAGAAPVNIGSRFSGLLQSLQTDLWLHFPYRAAMGAAGTSPPAVTLTGPLSAIVVPKPVIVKTSAGALGVATYNVYTDDIGTTSVQSGTTAATVSIASIPGLVLNFPSATYSGDNVFTARATELSDSSGAGLHATATTDAYSPRVSLGLNGFPGYSSSLNTSFLTSNLALPSAGTTPIYIYAIFRIVATAAASAIVVSGSTGTEMMIYAPTGGNAKTKIFNASPGPDNTNTTVGQWGRAICKFSNSTADSYRFGNVTVTGTNVGNHVPAATRTLFSTATGVSPSKCEILYFAHMTTDPGDPSVSGTAAYLADADALAKYGSSVQF